MKIIIQEKRRRRKADGERAGEIRGFFIGAGVVRRGAVDVARLMRIRHAAKDVACGRTPGACGIPGAYPLSPDFPGGRRTSCTKGGKCLIDWTKEEKRQRDEGAWVIRHLKKVVRICLSADPVLDKNGADTGRVSYRVAEAIKALELIGKSCGLFSPRTEEQVAGSQAEPPPFWEEDRRLMEALSLRLFGENGEQP